MYVKILAKVFFVKIREIIFKIFAKCFFFNFIRKMFLNICEYEYLPKNIHERVILIYIEKEPFDIKFITSTYRMPYINPEMMNLCYYLQRAFGKIENIL